MLLSWNQSGSASGVQTSEAQQRMCVLDRAHEPPTRCYSGHLSVLKPYRSMKRILTCSNSHPAFEHALTASLPQRFVWFDRFHATCRVIGPLRIDSNMPRQLAPTQAQKSVRRVACSSSCCILWRNFCLSGPGSPPQLQPMLPRPLPLICATTSVCRISLACSATLYTAICLLLCHTGTTRLDMIAKHKVALAPNCA